MRTRLAALAALVIIPVAGCTAMPAARELSPAPVAPPLVATNVEPPCEGDVVTVVGMDADLPCNVNPPSRLDVLGVTPQECDDMGGRIITVDRPMDGLVNCEGVDY